MCACPPVGTCKECSDLSIGLLKDVKKLIPFLSNITEDDNTSNLDNILNLIEGVLDKLNSITDEGLINKFISHQLAQISPAYNMSVSGHSWDLQTYKKEMKKIF